MKTLYIILLALLLLPACANTILTKPGFTQEAFARDLLTCRQAAVQEAMLAGLNGNPFVEITIRNGTKRCMLGLGYSEQKN